MARSVKSVESVLTELGPPPCAWTAMQVRMARPVRMPPSGLHSGRLVRESRNERSPRSFVWLSGLDVGEPVQLWPVPCSESTELAEKRSLALPRCRHRSCCTMCLVNTPRQRNVAPWRISSSRASSPSRLMQVRFPTSMTNSRTPRSAASAFHAFLSSVVQGTISLPSRTNRHCADVSRTEIFSIVG